MRKRTTTFTVPMIFVQAELIDKKITMAKIIRQREEQQKHGNDSLRQIRQLYLDQDSGFYYQGNG